MGTDLEADPLQLDLVGTFDTQVNNILQTVRLTRQEVDDLRKLFYDLERSLQNVWRGCKVMPFGSIVTGLGIKSSDVDVYVYVPDDYYYDQVNFVLQARRELRRRPLLFYQPFAITSAKVPIVKFYHIPTRRNCDVSFRSPAGVRNSKLIAHLLHTDKRALSLAILIKYWSKVHKLTGTNLVPNYALTILTIFYLQQENILPPIMKLQKPNNSFFVSDWNTAFDKRYIYRTENDQNLYELLGGFFKFCSTFDFEENIVSTFTGSPIPRKHFKYMEDLPEEFELYKRNVINEGCICLKIDTKMCIQDPFEHNRNCTAGVYPRLAQRFTLHVQLASKIYEENKSTDFLRDILTKKPVLPQETKKKKRNKDVLRNVSNNKEPAELSQHEENSENPNDTEVCNNSDISEEPGTSNDNLDLPNNISGDDTPSPKSLVFNTINTPKKRTLQNTLTDLYQQTKRRKI